MSTGLEDIDRRVSARDAVQNDTTQTLRWVVAKLGRVAVAYAIFRGWALAGFARR